MAQFTVPQQLVTMLGERRVIPFVGAGVSAALGLPGWEELLRGLGSGIEGVPEYEEVHAQCQGNALQVAEYYFLKHEKAIGPIRHAISEQLHIPVDPVHSSGAHVELVNLGAPQIYTTNFDDAIEKTFRNLRLPVHVIAIPRDLATTSLQVQHVVKYHGDLRYDDTLVLTESSYYSRLELEAPMDLKFRSDLLGRSVLFMGYSFRDINIRVIWFKLMEMMKDVPERDRPVSYIVRFEPSPVLDTLYESVGMKTITLDPEGKFQTVDQRRLLFARFMLELSALVSPQGLIPGTNRSMFLSRAVLDEVEHHLDRATAQGRIPRIIFGRTGLQATLERARHRRIIPEALREDARRVIRTVLRRSAGMLGVSWALNFGRQYGRSDVLTMAVASGLMAGESRRFLLDDPQTPWADAWSPELGEEDAGILIKRARSELSQHEGYTPDEDLAYCVDVLTRMKAGQIVTPETLATVGTQIDVVLTSAAKLYPAVSTHQVTSVQPDPEAILQEIQARVDAEAGDAEMADLDDEP